MGKVAELSIQSHFKCEESELGTGIGNRLQVSNTIHTTLYLCTMHTQSHQRGAVSHPHWDANIYHDHVTLLTYLMVNE